MDTQQQSPDPASDMAEAARPAVPAPAILAGGNGAAHAETAASPAANAPAAPAEPASPPAEKAQPAILYVEDDLLSREVMRLLLGKEMGLTGLSLIDDNHHFMDKVRALARVPDVIFLDIQMRPHDGYEMLEMLRADEVYRGARIIAMTASVMATDVEALKRAGFDGLIGKPIMRQAFPEQLEQILAGKAVWFVS